MSEQPPDLAKTIAEMRVSLGRVEAQLKKVRRYLFWSTFYGWVKLIVIFVPLALGIWYLSPYLSSLYASLGALSNTVSTMQGQNQDDQPSILDDPRVRAFIESQLSPQ